MEENKTKALVTPELLIWARKKAGLTIADVVEKIAVVPLIITSWEQGQTKPTISQARKLAEIYKVHFAMFFLPEPPKEKEKTTLREIIKSVKKYNEALVFSDKECLSYAEILKKTGVRKNGEILLSDLKRLEERIVKIIDKEELNKKHFLSSAMAIELSKGAIWACNEILGEK